MSLVPDSAGDHEAHGDRLEVLLRAALDLTGDHDVDHVLEHLVERAAQIASARYAALGIYDDEGRITRFVHHGLDADTVARIGHYPRGRGLLGEVIAAEGPIRFEDLHTDPRSGGLPAHHPEMTSFLGVPVRSGRRRLGNLYLTDKIGTAGFNEEDERLVVTLAAFAAAAVDGAQLAATEERARANREVLSQIIDAQEAERARVARDLHDQIGQSLTSVLLGLRLVIDALAEEEPDLADARAHANDVRTLIADALQDVRQLAFELRPTVLDDVGLVAAVRRLSVDLSQHHAVTVKIDLAGVHDDSRFPSGLETVVYRVVQEALTNVARHSGATHATVSLAADASRLWAVVTDDGIGFDVPLGRPRSLGLAGMTERAALAGGHVAVDSRRGEGTTVTLEVPLA